MGFVNTSYLIPATPEEVFQYLADLGNVPDQLEENIEVEFPVPPPKLGLMTEFEVSMTRFNVAARIICKVEHFEPGKRLSYRQLGGFFKAWSHSMNLDLHGTGQTRLSELVNFTMPYGLFGHIADDLFVRADIERIMNERGDRIVEHFNKRAIRENAP